MGHVYEEGGGAGLHPTKMLLQSLPNLTNQTTISQKSSNLGPHESFQTETYGRPQPSPRTQSRASELARKMTVATVIAGQVKYIHIRTT